MNEYYIITVDILIIVLLYSILSNINAVYKLLKPKEQIVVTFHRPQYDGAFSIKNEIAKYIQGYKVTTMTVYNDLVIVVYEKT